MKSTSPEYATFQRQAVLVSFLRRVETGFRLLLRIRADGAPLLRPRCCRAHLPAGAR